jgi:phage shock protein C
MNNALRRNINNRIIGGVASGLSRYFSIDAWLVRMVFLVLFFAAGGGVLIYLIMWIAIPEDQHLNTNNMETEFDNKTKKTDSGNIYAGVILISIGALFLLDRYFPEIDFRDIWPWSLIAVGGLLLFKGLRKTY